MSSFLNIAAKNGYRLALGKAESVAQAKTLLKTIVQLTDQCREFMRSNPDVTNMMFVVSEGDEPLDSLPDTLLTFTESDCQSLMHALKG